MWLTLALVSALLLGLYDISKKKALDKNSPLVVLLVVTGLSTIFLSPCLFIYEGDFSSHLMLIIKALIVSSSWISGIIALKLLPITTVSPVKATRPFFVVLFSLIIFGERLNALQWTGVSLALLSILLMSLSSKNDSNGENSLKGWIALAVSIATGVISALYDKHIIGGLEPLFIQSWGNLYITLILAVCIVLQSAVNGRSLREAFSIRWDIMMLLTAILITGADMSYFFALKQEGALLSIISILRRCSVIVTFVFGAIVFKEKNIRRKAAILSILIAGMIFMMIGS